MTLDEAGQEALAEQLHRKLWIGITAKVRDAKIALRQGQAASQDNDLGFVPLLYFRADYRFSERWHALFDIDALAGGPGRAIDLSLKLGYDISPRWAVTLGYRTVEGGADVESVYNFAWFNYAVALSSSVSEPSGGCPRLVVRATAAEQVRQKAQSLSGPERRGAAGVGLDMQLRCKYHICMSTLVQIRNVPRDVHRRLKARAAMAGMSMSEYALRELRKALERPDREEILERLASRPVRRLRRAAADVIRAERDSR